MKPDMVYDQFQRYFEGHILKMYGSIYQKSSCLYRTKLRLKASTALNTTTAFLLDVDADGMVWKACGAFNFNSVP